ncbi:MAG: hypothetical protein ACYTF0_04050 [Planctomycetota bacterium]
MHDDETTSVICPNLADFISRCQQQAVTTVIVAWRSEWGPAQIATDPGDYDWRRECRLLAYDAGRIISCELAQRKTDELLSELRAAGFTVEERSRNLTDFGANR